jgi:PhnB protein
MRIETHLCFSGQCRQAFEFYAELLGGSYELLRYGDSPAAEHVPADWHDKVVHGSLKVNDIEIAGADVLPEQYEQPRGFHLILQLEDEQEASRLFKGLASGGTISIPLGKTFWSACYGIVVDQFGISWEINCNDSIRKP